MAEFEGEEEHEPERDVLPDVLQLTDETARPHIPDAIRQGLR